MKNQFRRKMKNEKGITLIALIITIVILVILAAVSIRAVTNMGIVGQAVNGTQEYAQKAIEENQMMDETLDTIDIGLAKLKEALGETIYLEEFEGEGTKPYLPSSDYSVVRGTNLSTGLVITDHKTNGVSDGNEYVWIEIPSSYIDKSITAPDYSGLAGIEAGTAAYYTTIYDALDNYASDYRENGWSDEWCDLYGTTYDSDHDVRGGSCTCGKWF